MSIEVMKRIKSLLQDTKMIDSHTISAVVAECDMAILAKQPATGEPVDWPLRAQVWKRESTQEWVLEIEGTLGDTDMNIRHTQPLSVAYENVPGLPTFYTRPAPSVPNLIEKAISSGCFGVLPVKATIPMCKAGWGASGGELTFQQIGHIYEEMYKARPLPDDAHPAPSVPDGLQWFTVAEHGLPEVGEVVVGGLWYTDPWLKPEHATYFMWGQCRVVDTKHRDFKDGKQWRTFGPSHNQITNWARLNPPAMLAAKDAT